MAIGHALVILQTISEVEKIGPVQVSVRISTCIPGTIQTAQAEAASTMALAPNL